MIDDGKLHDCAAPHCRYRAPVCEYGYCQSCCMKWHTVFNLGDKYGTHRRASFANVEFGFKVLDRTPRVETKPQEPVGPVLGEVTPVNGVDYPISATASGYNTL